MKKSKPTRATKAGTGGGHKPAGTLYQLRLAEHGLAVEPIVAAPVAIRQFQLAHLAATLAREGSGGDAESSPRTLVTKAMQIWNASGRAVLVAKQADVLARGLFYFDRDDWQKHAAALNALLNVADGALHGYNPSAENFAGLTSESCAAGEAVSEVWRYGCRVGEPLKLLFPGLGETEQTRQKKLVTLLVHAKGAIHNSDQLPCSETPDALYMSIKRSWAPLGIWNQEIFTNGVAQARGLIENPEGVLVTSSLAFYPCVARWLAVMRDEQQSEAKKRT